MSENIRGITFAEQAVTPADDAIVRRAILGDGILSGCEISYSGSTLTMAAGYIIACGRSFQITAAQNFPVVDATSGVARLLITIDMTRTATESTFDQIGFSIEYASAEDGFVDLIQEDINLSGAKYQIVAAVVSLGTGGITGIVSKLERSEGGGGLNFKVVAGLTQPGTATENTLWVKTNKLTGWIISPTQPSNLSDGMVWIKSGVSGAIGFNALKKNGIQVYPLRVMQYTSGALKYVKSQIYQNGSWMRVWSGELFKRGDQYEDITGGWSSDGYTDASYQIWPGEITEEAISLQGYEGYYTMLGTDDPIDLTGFSGVRAVCRVASAGTVNYALGLFIASSKNNAISSGISWASAGAGDTEMMLPFPSGLQRAYVGVHAAPVDDALGTVLQIELY